MTEKRGIRFALVQAKENRQYFGSLLVSFCSILEIAYYDMKQTLRYLQSLSVSVINSWVHLIVSVSVVPDHPDDSVIEVRLGGVQSIRERVTRRANVFELSWSDD